MQDQSAPGEPVEPGEPEQPQPTSTMTPLSASLTQGFDATVFIKTYIETAKLIVLSPRVFFAQMPIRGGLVEPVTFLGVSVLINALLSGILHLSFLELVIWAVCPVIGVFAASGLAFGLAPSMGAKKVSFEAIVRVYCYAGIATAVMWVPIIGFLLGFYGFVLQFLGLKQVLKLDNVKTAGLCVVSGILATVATGIATVMLALKAAFHL